MIELNETEERVILVGVQQADGDDTEESVKELGELAQTAGAQVVGSVIQNREKIHPGTYIGKGKLDEVRMMLWETDATGIICDDELSPAQLNNLQSELDCKVCDRTLLILDIFARHAVTSEGKLQVELAQLRYRAARLTGLGNSLSRLGGGIGTRGPGEKKLEMDRRLIRARISHLKQELEEVIRHRELIRTGQGKSQSRRLRPLVGYTSVGKSAIFKQMTGADVLEDAKLFATLDTTTRGIRLSGKQEVLLTRYGWIYPQAAASSGRGIQEYAGGGVLCRYPDPCGRCIEPTDGNPDGGCLRDAASAGGQMTARLSPFSTSRTCWQSRNPSVTIMQSCA